MVIVDTQIIVLNPVLREILKRYDDAGAFEYLSPMCLDSEYRGVPAAYYDSGYEFEHADELMPRTIDEVTDCIIGIIAYEEEDNPNWDETREQIEAELMERDDEINAAYEYVLIKGSGLGWDEDDEEEYWEYGDVEIPDTSFEYTKEGFWESIESNKAKTKQSPKPKGKKSGKQPLIPKENSKTNDSIPKISDKSPAITGTRVSYDDCEIDSSGTLSAYNGDEVKIILPDGIRTIGEDAFFGKDALTSIVIPEGVERIENGAFWRCDSLENIVLPSTIRSIGDNAFYYCEALTSVVIPDGCEVLGEDCFTFCSNLKDIYVPASVYDIGHDAFCTFNNDTVIRTTIGSIAADYAKENDIKVDHMRVSASLGSSYINESAYVSDDAGQNTAETPISRNKCLIDTDDTLLKYFGDEPRIILPYGIRVIGDYAFDTRENLSSIVIPEGVECIGDSAFFSCVNLEKIVLPSTIRKIGESAFFNCESLTSIVIPEGCTEIGEDCFSCCNNITDIYAPASLYDIGKDAFQTYNSNTVIHAPRGSNVEVYAEENSITLAHNMASASSGSSDEKKSKSASTGSGIKKKSASSNAKKSSTKKAATKPTPDLTADSTAAHKAEEARRQAEAAEAARKAEEARKQAEAAEAARKAEEARKQAEAAEAARRAEEVRRQAEAARKAEEERKQAEAAEAARRAEEARRRAEVSRLNTVKAKTETAEEIDPIAEERRRLLKERKRQMRIVENNKGLFALFGEKARKRKAAEAKIEQINKELARLRRRK